VGWEKEGNGASERVPNKTYGNNEIVRERVFWKQERGHYGLVRSG